MQSGLILNRHPSMQPEKVSRRVLNNFTGVCLSSYALILGRNSLKGPLFRV